MKKRQCVFFDKQSAAGTHGCAVQYKGQPVAGNITAPDLLNQRAVFDNSFFFKPKRHLHKQSVGIIEVPVCCDNVRISIENKR